FNPLRYPPCACPRHSPGPGPEPDKDDAGDSALLRELAGYVDSGALRPVVDTVRPLAGLADAHRALESGGVRGKHVIQVAEETAA
ncbi:hypothetical protein ADL27_49500, partial [Streptomyces sp. NRRL F-6602]